MTTQQTYRLILRVISSPLAPRHRLIAAFFKEKSHDPWLSKKNFFKQKKIVDGSLVTRLPPQKSFSNKKKGPHPAQRHNSNSAFRR